MDIWWIMQMNSSSLHFSMDFTFHFHICIYFGSSIGSEWTQLIESNKVVKLCTHFKKIAVNYFILPLNADGIMDSYFDKCFYCLSVYPERKYFLLIFCKWLNAVLLLWCSHWTQLRLDQTCPCCDWSKSQNFRERMSLGQEHSEPFTRYGYKRRNCL